MSWSNTLKAKKDLKKSANQREKIRGMFTFAIWLPGGEVHDARVPVLPHLVRLNKKVVCTVCPKSYDRKYKPYRYGGLGIFVWMEYRLL